VGCVTAGIVGVGEEIGICELEILVRFWIWCQRNAVMLCISWLLGFAACEGKDSVS
jgi:hypothetical protein